jgi:prevent-host-death family protein
MAHLPASKARAGFSDTINRVAFGKERVVLRRRGKEIAAVVPIDDLRLLEELEEGSSQARSTCIESGQETSHHLYNPRQGVDCARRQDWRP